jgi:hypothetical protein
MLMFFKTGMKKIKRYAAALQPKTAKTCKSAGIVAFAGRARYGFALPAI